MKQILIQLDDGMAERLDRVAPGRSRKRSQFVRMALGKALWDLEEQATAEAYRQKPDRAEEAHFDPAVWEREWAGRSRKARRG